MISIAVYFALFLGVVFFYPFIFFPADAFIPANPFQTPAHIKPEWYFLAIYQFLKVATVFSFLGADAPRLFGIIVPGIGMALLFFLPFLDRGPKRPARKRPIMLAVLIITLAIMAYLTYLGQVS